MNKVLNSKMPLDYTNPHVINFLTEHFERVEVERMTWFLKNQDELVKLATIPDNSKGLDTVDVRKISVEACMPSMVLHHKTSIVNRRRKALRDGVIEGVSRLKSPSRRKGQQSRNTQENVTELLVPEPIMKSVDPDVQSILFKALPNGGRCQYLDKRKRVLPEDKYNFCETSTSVHGWRLKDSELSRQPGKYGRYFAFKRDVNSRSGPQPDPAYYQKPPIEPYSKCTG